MRTVPRRRTASSLVAAAAVLLLAAPAAQATITDYPVPTPDAGLREIVAGKDGNLWFTEQKGAKVGRITPSGQIDEWPVPVDSEFGPTEITVGENGLIWFLTSAGGVVGIIDPSAPPGPVSATQAFPGFLRGDDIAAAPDGTTWITDSVGKGIHRVVPTSGGYALQADSDEAPDCSFDGVIARGPDGRMWCAFQGDALKQIDLASQATVNHPVPSGFSIASLTSGPDGALWYGRYLSASWFTPASDGAIGRMTPDGGVQEWKLDGKYAPDSLVPGPDGAIWFATVGRDSERGIGRITPSGQVTVGNTGLRRPESIAFGADGAIWFVDANANRITRITTDDALAGGPVVTPPPAPPAPGGGGPVVVPPKQVTPTPTVTAKSLRVRKQRIAVGLACPKTAKLPCQGKLSLRTAKKLKQGKRKAFVTLTGSGSYSVKPGKQASVPLRLSAKGRKLVRRGRTTKVTVRVTPTGSKPVTVGKALKLRG